MRHLLQHQKEGKPLTQGNSMSVTYQAVAPSGRVVSEWSADLEESARTFCRTRNVNLVRVTCIKEHIK